MFQEKVQFKEVLNLTHSLIDNIIHKVSRPITHVIGFARGGMIPATLAAYRLDVPALCFSVSTYDDKKQTRARIHQLINFGLVQSGSNILVIDDICDTGKTLEMFKRYVKESNREDISFIYSSIYTKETSIDKVDFYGKVVDASKWIVFPWEEYITTRIWRDGRWTPNKLTDDFPLSSASTCYPL